MLRVLDKTGKLIHQIQLPGMATGVPMTYMANDRQFIVVAVGASGIGAELVALALPQVGLPAASPSAAPSGTTLPGGGALGFGPPPRPGGTHPSFEGPFWKNLASLLSGWPVA